MDFNERIQNLTQQISVASREVIIQDRILGQARERVAELQGRINMLVEVQQEEKQLVPGTRPPGSKPEPKPKAKKLKKK